MKTQKLNSLKTTFGVTLLALLFIISACNNKKQSDASTTDIKTPEMDIHTAVISENTEVLNQHIAAGTDINEKDPFGGSSPLISAAVFGKPKMARILIDAGADIDFQNNEGSTALISASFFCRPEIVQMLLDKGADKTIKNKFGATAYETVAAPFDTAKDAYDMMSTVLAPMGLKLDYDYLKKTRPEIAEMLK